MIELLAACLAIAVNCAYAIAALVAAERYQVVLRLASGSGLAILAAGTTLECAALFVSHGGLTQLVTIVACGAVVTAAACDAVCGYVFDAVTLPCVAMLLVLSIVAHAFTTVAGGALAAGGSLYVLHALTRGRGLGLGDVKLACCIGACVGALRGIEALGIAFVLGGSYAAFLLLTKRARIGAELRFAPYLAAGMAIVIFHAAVP